MSKRSVSVLLRQRRGEVINKGTEKNSDVQRGDAMLVQRQRVRQVEKKQDRSHMTKEFLCGVVSSSSRESRDRTHSAKEKS